MVLLRRFLENEAAQSSDNTTYTLNLPDSGTLSALMLKIRATNGSTDNKNNAIKDTITRVELLGNGSFVIFSMTGEELDRFSWFHNKRRPVELLSEDVSAVQFQTFIMPFGRTIGDKSFGLDLAKFRNVQLRIQYNLANVNAVGNNGFITGSFNVTVIEYRYPSSDGVSPQGFRRLREFVIPTDAASGTNRYEIPQQNKLVAIHTLVVEDAVADDTDVTQIQLEANSGELRIYDANWDDLQQENANEFGINPRQHKVLFRSDTDTIDFETGIIRGFSTHDEHVVESTADKEVLSQIESRSGSRVTIGTFTWDLVAGSEELAASTTDDTILMSVDGDGVGNWATIPLSRQADWSDALDSTRFDKLELVLTSGAAGATLGAITDEIANAPSKG